MADTATPAVQLSGLSDVLRTPYHNLPSAALIEESLRRHEGLLSVDGALCADTGHFTGRSPQDKFIVKDALTENTVAWGAINQPLSEAHFAALKRDMLAALAHTTPFVQDLYAGTDPAYRLSVRVITEYAWHSLFARNMFVRPETREARDPDFTVINLPSFRADPERHGCRSETVIAVSFSERLVLVGATEYAGEIKKSIFSVLNFLLPDRDVMPMHCSANVGAEGKAALFFGLSGTGKTTLSADPHRTLIGDDEHGWSGRGIFNFEGGCYAKVINLSPEAEPEIFATTKRFGTILENVVVDPHTRAVDFGDARKTENTRASYPIHFIPNASLEGTAGHPTDVVFLTADAFGVLPPIAKLSVEGAMYHFLSGYTAKVAGTERGVTEPKATFSTCFGAPFMPRHPGVYAQMLGDKLRQHGANVWLVNTGWSGGPYGTGARMKLAYTRAMVQAALSGALKGVPTRQHPVFNVAMPTACPGVPADVLDPKSTWADAEAYDRQAAKLARMFGDNFAQFASSVPEAVRAAGPNL
ncbi:phosphoenolpyruvate carboxykinase [Truepera radiovictrix]|uniref:Phosphoenolpyruvate carboxykinase (ATP) n=1 Tax=Truepera radiovictrix (strain DSM 17093 / CIP 108686 / LMG 22925 / RQ-24) TaxID=649638 RepID=D7CWX4_TRURR|nr:phosphoenolpyruvate carboxykinase [Truepera radiovictrix]ADI14482.1 phosphoenolpyruvate carboxykinase (ATP) [Truepera radiovictrix DSM 17093]WMT56963.1 phosphoenolpyruvate carboxykinase [Truepera radiovictrix]